MNYFTVIAGKEEVTPYKLISYASMEAQKVQSERDKSGFGAGG